MNINYQELAQKLVLPSVKDYIRVEVSVDINASLLMTYVHSLHASLEAKVMTHGGTLSFSEDELLRYCQTLVVARVKYVRNERHAVSPRDRVAVPSFLSVVLQNLGEVTEHGIGLTLTPVVTFGEDFVPMSGDEVFAFANKLRVLGPFGFEYADELPRDRNGSFDFMTVQFIENEVVSHTSNPTPAVALLASLLQLKMLESVFTPRVRYGDVTLFRRIIEQLSSVKG